MEGLKPSKVIFLMEVPKVLLDKRILRQHFSLFGTIRRVSLDMETDCCSVLFTTTEAAQKAFLEGNIVNNYRLKIRLGTSISRSEIEHTETVRETHVYDDLDMNLLEDENDMFASEQPPDIDEDGHSEKELFKMKKKIMRKLHEEKKDSVNEGARKIKKVAKPSDEKSSKLLKKSNTTSMSSAELSKMKSLEKKFEILDERDKLYRDKLKAIKFNVKIGICPDMCPEKERIMRAYRKLWAPFEQQQGVNRLAPELAVKEYSRSSANQEEPLPHELRPEPVLSLTMNYLVLKIMPLIDHSDIVVSEWYDFLWDRLRGIRKDIVQQQLCSVNTAAIIEQCARFHILCFDRMCGQDVAVFDEKINTENLNNCLQSLLQMYDDLHQRGTHFPNEAEFRAYEVLAKLDRGDIIWEFQQLSAHLQMAPEILFALKTFSAFKNNMFSTFFKLVKNTTYLNACLLQRYFGTIRSQALQTVVTAFCRPLDPNFKTPINSLKNMLHFNTDSDVISFCNLHGMVLTEDGDLSIGKYDFSFPPRSAYLPVTLDEIKRKRLFLPLTVTSSTQLPQEVDHKVHSSFDPKGNLKKSALNVMDQIKKLKRDFDFDVENMPNITIEKYLLSQSEPLTKESDFLKSNTSAPKSVAPGSNLFTKSSTAHGFETKDILESSENPINPFKKDNLLQTKSDPEVPNIFQRLGKITENVADFSQNQFGAPNLFKTNVTDVNIFKKPLAPLNLFSKPSEVSLFQKPTLPTQFGKVAAESNLFCKTIPESSEPKRTHVSKIETESNIFSKPSNELNIFKKAAADPNLFQDSAKHTSSSSNIFLQQSLSVAALPIATNSNLFMTTLDNDSKHVSSSAINIFSKSSDSNIFSKFSTNTGSIFDKPASFSEFMHQKTLNEKNVHGKSKFDFLEKNNQNQLQKETLSKTSSFTSGFEKSYELFLKESEQQSRKRVANEQELEERKKEFDAMQKEKMKQRQIEMEQRKQEEEIRRQKEKETELEMKRLQEIEIKRQIEEEIRKQKELEAQLQRELEREQQRQWVEKLKQDVLELKVNFDLELSLKVLEKQEAKKMKEHELEVIRLRQEKELRKLRGIVKKKIRYIHARRCLQKWKHRVELLKINKLGFSQFVLSSIENQTAVWGSMKKIKTPFNMNDRLENSKIFFENSKQSHENLYLGDKLVEILKTNQLNAKFIKEGCSLTTPLVWKVSFHLPKLNDEFKSFETNINQFVCKMCYNDKLPLGKINCLRSPENTLCSIFNLFQTATLEFDMFKGTNLYIFMISQLWETLDESINRFKLVMGHLTPNTQISVVIYRSNYNINNLHQVFSPHYNHRTNFFLWNTASDISNLIIDNFKSYFSCHQPAESIYYESMHLLLSNEIENLFLQVKLDSDELICKYEMSEQFKNPNYFIDLFNVLLFKLENLVEQTGNIDLATEFNEILFHNKESNSIILNNTTDQLNVIVNDLKLPYFKRWPISKLSTLKKVLKHFCKYIDRSGRNELFTNIMRQLNPPKENFYIYISNLKWISVIMQCILYHLDASRNRMRNKFIFYDKEMFEQEMKSHWWMDISLQ